MSGFFLCIIAIVIGFTQSEVKPESFSWTALGSSLLGGSVACYLFALGASKRSAKLLSARSREAAAETFIRMRRFVWIFVLSFYALLIHGLSYNYIIKEEKYFGLGTIPVISEVMVLAPFFLFASSALAGLRSGENLLKGSSWRTGKYISFHLRQYMLPVFPFLVFSGLTDTIAYFPAIEEVAVAYDFAAVGGLVLLVFLFMLFAPLFLKIVWKSEPLQRGELRESLERLARDSGVKMREILLWHTGGGVANAVVAGLIAPFRYVFLTDGLLANLTNREIEAVFAHEMGHARRRHVVIYFSLIISFLFIASFVEQPVQNLISFLQEHLSKSFSLLYIAYAFGLLILFWFVIFGYVSRRLEQSADAFAVERVGSEPFATALERIVEVSEGGKFLSTWRHFSAAKRAQFAREAPGKQKGSRVLIILLALLFGSGILFFLLSAKMDLSRPESEILAIRAGYRENKKDLEGAEKLLRKAVQISPGEAKYHYYLGLVLLNKGEREDALEAFEAALALAPQEEKYRKKVREFRGPGNYPGD
jgi:Zn-dependent protease with chaperone function